MYAQVGGTEPGEAVVTLLEAGGGTEVVVVIVAIDLAGHGVTVHVGVVEGEEEAGRGHELEAQGAFLVKAHGVAACEAEATAFALPASVGVKADTVDAAMQVGSEVGSEELSLALEVTAQLELHVAGLEELLRVPLAMGSPGDAQVVGEVTVEGVVLELQVGREGPSEVGHIEEVVQQVGAHGDEVATGILHGGVVDVECLVGLGKGRGGAAGQVDGLDGLQG